MNDYVHTLEAELALNADAETAAGQEAYMRHKFSFYGIRATQLKEIARPFFHRGALPSKGEIPNIVKHLWQKPQRECQYFAQQLAFKYTDQPDAKDLALYEHLVSHKSWWDTVDFVATKLIGGHFKAYPNAIAANVMRWLRADDLWLRRTALIFQLKYKDKTDTGMLSKAIESQLGSREFFINKAIGWALREYGKTDPNWVIDFTNSTDLHPLSRREALKHL